MFDLRSRPDSFNEKLPMIGALAAFLVTLMVLSGCGKHEKPNFIFMPDMHFSPALKAQEAMPMLPPKGTIPRGYEPYQFANMDVVQAGTLNRNPLPRSKEHMLRGQKLYNIYCIVCHGPAGEGDGNVVPKFPRPPSLQSDKLIGYADGSIYHVITNGQNLMSNYAAQIQPKDRWAIIHYIRALQKAKHPTAEDLKAAERLQEGT